MMALRACACPYGGPAPSRFGGRAGDLPRSPRWGCLARSPDGTEAYTDGALLYVPHITERGLIDRLLAQTGQG